MNTDLTRRLTVTVAEVVCVVGTLVGVGVFGGPQVQQAAGGALAADATYIAPAAPAFAIWSVIYTGLAAYTIWQWLPAQATERHRRIGFLAAASMALNALWLLVVRADRLWVSVAVIVALAVTLGLILVRLTQLPAESLADRIITDATFGLYLGWVSVATCANVAASLVDAGVEPGRPVAELVTVAVLAVAAGLGWLYAARFGRRLPVAAAMGWGLAWIAVGRLSDRPESTLVGVTAAVAAALVLLAPIVRRPVPAVAVV